MQRASSNLNGTSSDVFIKVALEQLESAKEAKRLPQLKEACKSAYSTILVSLSPLTLQPLLKLLMDILLRHIIHSKPYLVPSRLRAPPNSPALRRSQLIVWQNSFHTITGESLMTVEKQAIWIPTLQRRQSQKMMRNQFR